MVVFGTRLFDHRIVDDSTRTIGQPEKFRGRWVRRFPTPYKTDQSEGGERRRFVERKERGGSEGEQEGRCQMAAREGGAAETGSRETQERGRGAKSEGTKRGRGE